MAWGEFCISNLIFSPNGFLVASRIITYSCLAFWEVLRTRLSRLTDEKTRWRRPCKNEAMLHPHLRLKSSTCCAKKLKGRIYGKSLFAQLFCGLIFRYFPTDGLCASFCNENARKNMGWKKNWNRPKMRCTEKMTRSSGKSKLSSWSLTQKICRKLNASFTRREEEDYYFDGAWKARFLEDAALHYWRRRGEFSASSQF